MSQAVNIHGVRHTHATLLIRAGVDIKVVSERLGRQDITTTMRIYYYHVIREQHAGAAEVVGQLFSPDEERDTP